MIITTMEMLVWWEKRTQRYDERSMECVVVFQIYGFNQFIFTCQIKVVLHDAGTIECLDQGNFPHPLSCRKFISCARMDTGGRGVGGVIGWEYTCPKGLSYDPVGGICNWAAGLGCKD